MYFSHVCWCCMLETYLLLLFLSPRVERMCWTNMCCIALLSNVSNSIIDQTRSVKSGRDFKCFSFYFFLRLLYGGALVYWKCILRCSIQYRCWTTSLAECGTRRTWNFICPKVSRPEARPSPFRVSSMSLIGQTFASQTWFGGFSKPEGGAAYLVCA